MGKKADEKTNVMRVLDQKKISYKSYCYAETGAVNGMEVAEILKENPDTVFKTLVTVGKTGNHYVFVVPVNRELDLKKAASAAGEKSIEMLKAKDLLPLTGYVHGGCSPLGMKKAFPTFFHADAQNGTIYVSGGKIGLQVEVTCSDLLRLTNGALADLTRG